MYPPSSFFRRSISCLRSWTCGTSVHRGALLCCLAALASGSGGSSEAVVAAASPVTRYCVWVFSKPVEGKENEFNAWYDGIHIPDMLKIPGFKAAQRFQTEKTGTPTSLLPRYLAIYDVDSGDLDATNTEVKRRMAAGILRKSDAMDYASIVSPIFRPLTSTLFAKDVPGSQPAIESPGHPARKTFDLIVISNPEPGREAEFNAWYDGQHVPDVLRVPGFVSAQRFVLVQNESPTTTVPRYLVRFEFQSYDLDGTITEIGRRIQSGQTRMSTSMAADPMVYFVSPLGPTVSSPP